MGIVMILKVLATSKDANFDMTDFNLLAGRVTGICYSNATIDEIIGEDKDKTLRKVNYIKDYRANRIFDHNLITLFLGDVPKFLATLLRSEGFGIVSEQILTEQAQSVVLNKWRDVFVNKLIKKMNEDNPMTFSQALVNETADYYLGYLTPSFAPTNIVYTTTHQNLNSLVMFLDKLYTTLGDAKFENTLKLHVKELATQLKSLPFYTQTLSKLDSKHQFKLFANNHKIEEYFGDVYSTSYRLSMLGFSQLQKVTTAKLSIRVMEGAFYIPPIIKDSDDLTNLWLEDIGNIENFPMGTLLEVIERGTLDDFVSKTIDIVNVNTYDEIRGVHEQILTKYDYALRLKVHTRAEELNGYIKKEK